MVARRARDCAEAHGEVFGPKMVDVNGDVTFEELRFGQAGVALTRGVPLGAQFTDGCVSLRRGEHVDPAVVLDGSIGPRE